MRCATFARRRAAYVVRRPSRRARARARDGEAREQAAEQVALAARRQAGAHGQPKKDGGQLASASTSPLIGEELAGVRTERRRSAATPAARRGAGALPFEFQAALRVGAPHATARRSLSRALVIRAPRPTARTDRPSSASRAPRLAAVPSAASMPRPDGARRCMLSLGAVRVGRPRRRSPERRSTRSSTVSGSPARDPDGFPSTGLRAEACRGSATAPSTAAASESSARADLSAALDRAASAEAQSAKLAAAESSARIALTAALDRAASRKRGRPSSRRPSRRAAPADAALERARAAGGRARRGSGAGSRSSSRSASARRAACSAG